MATVLINRKDKARVDMTCDVKNGNLNYLANNNNITTLKENHKPNGIIGNGKAEVPKVLDEEVATRKSLMILSTIFITSLVAMFYIYKNFPELDESEKEKMKIPFDIEDAKQLGRVLDRYKDLYYFEVMTGICLLYLLWVIHNKDAYSTVDSVTYISLFTISCSLLSLTLKMTFRFIYFFSLQTFAIPGSLFLSILSGFLFRFPVALSMICFCSALGATLCYLLSHLLGRRLVKHYFPKRAESWSHQVQNHKDDMLSYILFLRMTPLLPNWFINLVAPVIGVPLVPFALGTFLGVAPPSFIAIEAGKTLYKMTSSSMAFSWTSISMLLVFSTLALAPVIFKKYFKSKIE